MTIAGDRNEVRFDGEDMEWTSAIGTWQRVDGVEYENGKPTGSHDRELLPGHSSPRSASSRSSRSPERARFPRELPDGGFKYRATATAGEVFDAMPIAAGRAQGSA